MDYYTAGVALQWNLWSWGGDKSRVEQQRIGILEIQEREAKARDDIQESIQKLLNDIHVVGETRVLLDAQIVQEVSKQEMLKARLEQGLATATEVVDAETALTTARIRREQNEIRYAMKITELAAAIGQNE
jgi:outer membrane protein TolC